MASSSSLLLGFKALFILLACIMAAAIAYTLAMDGDSSCFDPRAWWTQVVETDFFIFMIFIVAWFFYKQSSWIKRSIFILLMVWFGSFVPCAYIAVQFFKLSHEESLKDPVYFVIARHQNGDVNGQTMRSYGVSAAKVIVATMGCYLIGVIIYAFIIDGLPFFVKVLTPCMITSTIDVYTHIVVFSVWIAYKESSLISAICWIVLLVCFSGIGICVYIMVELFYLSHGQPISLILFNKSNRDMTTNDPLLMGHSDV